MPTNNNIWLIRHLHRAPVRRFRVADYLRSELPALVLAAVVAIRVYRLALDGFRSLARSLALWVATIATGTPIANRLNRFTVYGLIAISASSVHLIAAPIITRIETHPPTESTPPFLVYENVNGRWYVNDSHGYPGPCVEVRLSWTTEPGKRYWVECGSNEQPKSGDNTPTVRLNRWRRVSLDIAGTGELAHWTNGVPWSWAVFAVREQ